jgi:hypothetical protein
LKDEAGRDRRRPQARTLPGTRERLAGMGWICHGAHIAKSNQPDRSTEMNVHGHG